jgi:hypothetical protein
VKLDRRTDLRFAAMVDAAAGSCRVRQQFWLDYEAKGLEFALVKLGRNGSNAAAWCNAIRDRYKELTNAE